VSNLLLSEPVKILLSFTSVKAGTQRAVKATVTASKGSLTLRTKRPSPKATTKSGGMEKLKDSYKKQCHI
jgi:hypothetical protein